MQIQDRVALVTGGASGLGAAAVRRFVQAGARAAIIDRDQDRGRQMAEQLGNAVIHCPCDVSDEEQVVAAIDKTIEAFGQIDVLLNAAGIGGSIRTVTRDGPHPLDHFKKVVGINLIGTFSVLSQCASRMVNNEPDADGCRGVIVNTSSIAAFDGQIGQVAYSASKGGLVGMTLPIARDLASLGIRCCTICPGIMDTPLLHVLPDDVKASLESGIPHPRRLGTPDEFAMLVEQIVLNPYLNGETIRLDGGLRMAPK